MSNYLYRAGKHLVAKESLLIGIGNGKYNFNPEEFQYVRNGVEYSDSLVDSPAFGHHTKPENGFISLNEYVSAAAKTLANDEEAKVFFTKYPDFTWETGMYEVSGGREFFLKSKTKYLAHAMGYNKISLKEQWR